MHIWSVVVVGIGVYNTFGVEKALRDVAFSAYSLSKCLPSVEIPDTSMPYD